MPDLLDAHLELYQRLERRGRWRIAEPLRRVVAMILATVPLDDPYGALEDAAEVLRRKSGWFGPLSSPVRYCVAALVIRRGLPPGRVHDRVVESLARMKRRGLPWGGAGRTLAAVLIALRRPEGRVPDRVFERMRRIHRLWQADHPLITGSDDLPMLAYHALGDEDPGPLSDRIEEIYRELRLGGAGRGNALQLASHLLAVLPWRAGEAAGRFRAIQHAFEARRERIGRSRYDEVALLALLPGPPDALVRQLLGDRDRLRAHRPRPPQEVAFGLATGIAIAGHGLSPRERRAELASLGQVRDVLEAQQAALAVSAAVAAAVASG